MLASYFRSKCGITYRPKSTWIFRSHEGLKCLKEPPIYVDSRASVFERIFTINFAYLLFPATLFCVPLWKLVLIFSSTSLRFISACMNHIVEEKIKISESDADLIQFKASRSSVKSLICKSRKEYRTIWKKWLWWTSSYIPKIPSISIVLRSKRKWSVNIYRSNIP